MKRTWIVFARLSVMVTMLLILLPKAYAGDWLETYGDVGQIALPVAALVMAVAQDDKEGAMQFAKAFTATTAVTYGLKYTINSKRPNSGNQSFPSGHTSAAFAGAGFIQQRYGWEYGIPAYVAAALVGVSRVTSNNHHVEDVIAGAALGILSNLVFTTKFEKKNVMISPIHTNGGVGVILTHRW